MGIHAALSLWEYAENNKNRSYEPYIQLVRSINNRILKILNNLINTTLRLVSRWCWFNSGVCCTRLLQVRIRMQTCSGFVVISEVNDPMRSNNILWWWYGEPYNIVSSICISQCYGTFFTCLYALQVIE